MVYSPHAPYEILATKLIDFATMQRLRRFARYWDLLANSGNFIQSTPLIWGSDSPSEQFMRFSDWIFQTTGQTHAIALSNLLELLFEFLTTQRGLNRGIVAEALWQDYQRGGRSDRPAVLRPYVQPADTRQVRPAKAMSPPRQARHLSLPDA
jgi:Protein of unknown function (DUF4080)